MIYGYQEIFRVRLTTFLNDSNYRNFDLVFRLVLSYNEVLNKNRLREKNSSFTIKFYHAVGKDSWVLFKLNNFLENILQATKVWLASVNYVMVTIGKQVLKNFRKFLSEEPFIRIFIWGTNRLFFDLLLNWRLSS